jgi:signal transduction histidine kinase
VFRDLFAESAALPGDFASLPGQHSVFAILNLLLLLALWGGHNLFASFWGAPSTSLLAVLGGSFLLRAVELLWLRKRALNPAECATLAQGSIAFNLALALLLASLVDREDSQYSALLVVPILESAFQFGLAATVGVALAADGILFYWVWRYFELHPPVRIGEYFEAGTNSIILLLVAVLCSTVIQRLRRKEAQLAKSRERFLEQERMAAVGRISSAVAHEIRNPVAMISSSLATARSLEGADREEMLEIASKESSRLVRMTRDLLDFARPCRPQTARAGLRDTLLSVAGSCRAHAEAKGVTLRIQAPDDVVAEHDATLLQQALMNLIINAVDASPAGSAVSLALTAAGRGQARIDVENPGGPIPRSAVERLFEPFFTTKPNGTGLGLPTAYNILRAQGAELTLERNSQDVCFSVLLPGTSQSG